MSKKVTAKNNQNIPVTLGLLSDATDTVLKGMQSMFDEQNKRFDSLGTKIDYVHNDLQKQIDDLKFDATTRKDFMDLKKKVAFYHPAS